MQSLIRQLQKYRPAGIHTIVLIGAGDGADLPALRALNSRKMLLVEANPEQLKLLSRRIEPALGEEVLPVAATHTGKAGAKLFLCNNPRYSSLSRADQLEKHFPNLHITGETEVRTLPLPEILAAVSEVDDVGKLLILDAPGQSLSLVRSVPTEVLETFDWIIVSVADAALFDGDDAVDCLAALDAAGFDPVAEDSGSIAPERRILLQRNDPKVHRARLAVEQKRYSGQIAQLEIRHKTELDKITAELARQVEDHKGQLAKLTTERDRQAKLVDERQIALDKTTAALAGEKKLAADRQAQFQSLTQERDAQAKAAAQHKADLDKTTAALAGEKKLAADQQAQIRSLTQDRDTQTQSVAQLKAELDRVHQQVSEQKVSLSEREALLRKVSLQNQERGARIVALEKQQTELKQRQAWLDEEMTKAEAQVEFIKDVFLRDPPS